MLRRPGFLSVWDPGAPSGRPGLNIRAVLMDPNVNNYIALAGSAKTKNWAVMDVLIKAHRVVKNARNTVPDP